MSCDTIQYRPAWADGAQVPSVGPTYPDEQEGDTEDRYTAGYRDACEAAKEVMRRFIASRNPLKIGRLMLALDDKIQRSISAETASELGMTRQAWQKYHMGVEKLLPIGGIMSTEQRQRMSLSKRRGRKKSPAGLTQTGPAHETKTSINPATSTKDGNR